MGSKRPVGGGAMGSEVGKEMPQTLLRRFPAYCSIVPRHDPNTVKEYYSLVEIKMRWPWSGSASGYYKESRKAGRRGTRLGYPSAAHDQCHEKLADLRRGVAD